MTNEFGSEKEYLCLFLLSLLHHFSHARTSLFQSRICLFCRSVWCMCVSSLAFVLFCFFVCVVPARRRDSGRPAVALSIGHRPPRDRTASALAVAAMAPAERTHVERGQTMTHNDGDPNPPTDQSEQPQQQQADDEVSQDSAAAVAAASRHCSGACSQPAARSCAWVRAARTMHPMRIHS